MPRIMAVARRAHIAHADQRKPGFNCNFEKVSADETEMWDEMQAINKAAGPGLAVGRCLNFGVADGTASYIVTKIRKSDVIVEWIPMGDGYCSDAVGLNTLKTHNVILRSTAEQYCRLP